MKYLRITILAVIVLVASCTPWQREAAFVAADAACILIKDKKFREVCATADELEPLVRHLLAARAFKAENKIGAGAHVDACEVPVKDD